MTDRNDRAVNVNLPFKVPCRVTTDANVTLSGLQTIDGHTLVEGERVLCTGQTDATTNGIYVATSGLWYRAPDSCSNRDLRKGCRVIVTDGTLYDQTEWLLTSDDPHVIDANDQTWEQYCQAGTLSVSLTKSGTFQDESGDGFAQVGETISYTFTVTNDGDIRLTDLVLTDDTATVSGGPIAELLPDATDSTTFTATYTITQDDIDAGSVDNTAKISSAEGASASDSATVTLTAGYRIILFDNSCHDYISDDIGETWTEGHTPTETSSDDWTDMQMSINDGDYATMCAFDINYQQTNFTSRIATSATGATDSWTLHAPYDSGAYSFISGAITSGAETILAVPSVSDDDTHSYPVLSTDSGSTWSMVATELSSGRFWTRCCFSQNASIMYAVSDGNHVSTSTDSGATWSDLANSPTNSSSAGEEGVQRIRCSQDGKTIAYVFTDSATEAASAYVSTDQGASWTDLSLGVTATFVDCSMSLDGTVILFSFRQNTGDHTRLFLTTDGGATHSELSPPGKDAAKQIFACAVSTDGEVLVAAYSDNTIDVSTDQGSTWDTKTVSVVQTGLEWTAAYVVPQ